MKSQSKELDHTFCKTCEHALICAGSSKDKNVASKYWCEKLMKANNAK